ncbi:hypothetical protein ACFLYF_01425 [Chloroflexota bacterium]
MGADWDLAENYSCFELKGDTSPDISTSNNQVQIDRQKIYEEAKASADVQEDIKKEQVTDDSKKIDKRYTIIAASIFVISILFSFSGIYMSSLLSFLGVVLAVVLFIIIIKRRYSNNKNRSVTAKKGFDDWAGQKIYEARREIGTRENSTRIISSAASRNLQVPCKVCKTTISELAAVCPNCGESLPGLPIQCPKCFASHVTIEKKGFSVGQATAGVVALGAIGLVAGLIGGGDTRLVCLGCGYKWTPPKLKKDNYLSYASYTPSTPQPDWYKPMKRLKTPYIYRDDIKTYRCEYCHKQGRYHYCKSDWGIEDHIKEHQVYD